MITLCTGAALSSFLSRIEENGGLFSQVIICTPFIDDEMSERISAVAAVLDRKGCGFQLVTRQQRSAQWRNRMPGANQTGWCRLVICRDLHAKVYLAIARNPRHSILVVTSANATNAALTRNIELGISIKGETAESAEFINQARHALERLAAIQRRRTWIKR